MIHASERGVQFSVGAEMKVNGDRAITNFAASLGTLARSCRKPCDRLHRMSQLLRLIDF